MKALVTRVMSLATGCFSGGPANTGCPTTALRCCSGAAGLWPYPVIDRGSATLREAPGPRPKLVAPMPSAALKAVEDLPGQGLAEAGDQERVEGPISGWQGWAAEGGSARGTGQSSAETE